MNLVLLNHWFGQGATEVKLIEFHVEDEGCPHIVFSVHTPINFLHGAEARMDKLKINARVFVTGSEAMAIDGFIVTVEEEFDLAKFHKQYDNDQISVEKAADDFKIKLKVSLAEQCIYNEMTSELETKVFSLCKSGDININHIELMDNVSRSVMLLDEAMIEFNKLLELSINLKQVDQTA